MDNGTAQQIAQALQAAIVRKQADENEQRRATAEREAGGTRLWSALRTELVLGIKAIVASGASYLTFSEDDPYSIRIFTSTVPSVSMEIKFISRLHRVTWPDGFSIGPYAEVNVPAGKQASYKVGDVNYEPDYLAELLLASLPALL